MWPAPPTAYSYITIVSHGMEHPGLVTSRMALDDEGMLFEKSGENIRVGRDGKLRHWAAGSRKKCCRSSAMDSTCVTVSTVSPCRPARHASKLPPRRSPGRYPLSESRTLDSIDDQTVAICPGPRESPSTAAWARTKTYRGAIPVVAALFLQVKNRRVCANLDPRQLLNNRGFAC